MARFETARTIGLWGHYHGGNQGDECVVAAIIQNIRARRPDVTLLGFSLDPADTRRRHGIESYPIHRPIANGRAPAPEATAGPGSRFVDTVAASLKRVPWLHALLRPVVRTLRVVAGVPRELRFLWRAYRTLKGVDLLVVCGSGPLSDDWIGPFGHPYAVFKWAMLARAAGTRFVLLCVGAGPIDFRLTRFFLRSAVRGSAYRSFRDPTSARLIAGLGVGGENPVLPDLAFSLDLGRPKGVPPPWLRRGRGVVGLNPLPHHDGRYLPAGDPVKYRAFVERLADFAGWLIENDYAIVLLSTQLTADPRVCADLVRTLRERGVALEGRLDDRPIVSFDTLVDRIAWCDYVVAARFHCIILPFMLGKPVMALAYHPKTVDLMGYMGQSEHCVDIDHFTREVLVERFGRLVAQADTIRRVVAERAARNRELLTRQYDDLFGPVRAR